MNMKVERETIERIKRSVSCERYLERSPKGGLYCCPFCESGRRENETGALKVYENNTFFCHACRKSGDVIDLRMKTEGEDFSEAVEALAAEAGIEAAGKVSQSAQSGPRRAEAPTGDTPTIDGQKRGTGEASASWRRTANEYIRNCHLDGGETAAAYFSGRGITPDTAITFKLGYDAKRDCVVIPYPDADPPYYITRSMKGKTFLKPHRDQAGDEPIFNVPALYEGNPCYICEGQIDAISITQAGGSAVAVGGTGSGRVVDLLRGRPTKHPVILCFDSDGPGRKASDETKRRMDAEGIPYIEAKFSDGYSGDAEDPNDLLQADPKRFAEDVEANMERARAWVPPTPDGIDQTGENPDPTGIDSFLMEIRTERYKPIPTGIKALDKLLCGGFMPQTLVIMGAPAGAGKTILAQEIFESMATAGRAGIYYNLEMSREQLLARSLSRRIHERRKAEETKQEEEKRKEAKQEEAGSTVTKLTALDILRGYSLTEESLRLIDDEARKYKSEIGDRLVYNPDGMDADLDGILNSIERAAKASEDEGKAAPNICVDYLHLLHGAGGEDATGTIKRAVAGLKAYAQAHNAVVFAIMAQNRTANKSGDPGMESGRDTSAIEYSADLLLHLVPDADDPSAIRLQISKSRFTPITSGRGYSGTKDGAYSYIEFEDKEDPGTGKKKRKKDPDEDEIGEGWKDVEYTPFE